jgi:XTP/dITP diphosphohydrolase
MLNKKIIKLLIGTNNAGKLKEIEDLLPKKIDIYYPALFKIKSPNENGKSFIENSAIKAKFFLKKQK